MLTKMMVMINLLGGAALAQCFPGDDYGDDSEDDNDDSQQIALVQTTPHFEFFLIKIKLGLALLQRRQNTCAASVNPQK